MAESSSIRLYVEIFGVAAIAGSLIFVGLQLRQDYTIHATGITITARDS